MRTLKSTYSRAAGVLVLAAVVMWASPASAEWVLGPEELVPAGGADILVPGYSVPSFAYWNDDGLMDLIVGEGGGGFPGKVRMYLNTRSSAAPQFGSFVYAQSEGADLVVAASGCLGAFPRVAYWDGDGRKDLLIGLADGTVKVFLNVGSDADPSFDAGTLLEVGLPGTKVAIDVGSRATPALTDWNNDGERDLVLGALDGKVRVFVNEGTTTAPDYHSAAVLQDAGGGDLLVPGARSSPVVTHLDGDGNKDLLTGNTNGQLLLYLNVGTDQAPSFSGYTEVTADGLTIDLPYPGRSRPFVCDWTGDGLPDVLVGNGDDVGGNVYGRVRLYQGVPEPAALTLLAAAAPFLVRRKRTR